MKKISVGGQAVLEGVMMRAPGVMTVAVRRADGSIEVHKEDFTSVSDRIPLWKKPFFRGILALGQSLMLGFKALNYSSSVAMADVEMEENAKKGIKTESAKVEAKGMSPWAVAGVLIATAVLGIGFFFMLPLYLTELAGKYISLIAHNSVVYNLFEGVIRIIFLILYIVGIALLPDIKRIFQYHGAEHKSIATYESDLPLSVSNARPFSTLHPRCGTAFLLMVMVTAIIIFSIIPTSLNIWVKAISRLLLLPVIAGVAFEMIKKAGESSNPLWKILIQPGLWLQKVTTKEPDDLQLEVGLEALKAALESASPDNSDPII